MTLPTLLTAMTTALPELAARCRTKLDELRPDEPIPYHCIVADVFNPLLLKNLYDGADGDLRKRLFDFMEDMARSMDLAVVNILHVTILEELILYPPLHQIARHHMGSHTTKSNHDMIHRMHALGWITSEQLALQTGDPSQAVLDYLDGWDEAHLKSMLGGVDSK